MVEEISQSILFESFRLGTIMLDNRIVMAPLTRCRAMDHVPNELMAEYYAQRATAGLIISEGTAPSPNGIGYARIPGIYSKEQLDAWKPIADRVHELDGRIFMQLMHTGRMSHPDNMPQGSRILAPSVVPVKKKKLFVDGKGPCDLPPPGEMSEQDIEATISEFGKAAQNAVASGMDGIEIHGANGYLVEQFISPVTNKRTDYYGGSVDNRIRFAVEVAREICDVIGADRVGMRISPLSIFNEMDVYPAMEATYYRLAEELADLGLVYLHLVDHEKWGNPPFPRSFKEKLGKLFKGPIILCGAYDRFRAEKDLESGLGDLVAYGRPYISNPDLVERMHKNAILNVPDPKTFYKAGPQGYIDYGKMDNG